MTYKLYRFGFVLNHQEKQALTRLAEIEGGLSEAATLRRLIRRAAKETGVWKSPRSRPIQLKFRQEFGQDVELSS